MLKTLGYFVLGCHALVLPTGLVELDIEIRIKSGAGNEVSGFNLTSKLSLH